LHGRWRARTRGTSRFPIPSRRLGQHEQDFREDAARRDGRRGGSGDCAGACRQDARRDQGARQLVCGVNTGLAGFSAADSQGNWTGLDVDICRAIAASILGDGSKVKWVPLNAQQRLTALQSGEIDILSRNTTWTLTRDASLG